MHHRATRSYVLRGGRISKTRQGLLKDDNSRYLLRPENFPLNWEHIFGKDANETRSSKRVLEIGFGNGESLLAAAVSRPQDCFIGIEVYPNGIAALLLAMQAKEIENIRVLKGDAAQCIDLCFISESLDEIRVFFPDPWPKRKHHKRRLLNPLFLQLLLSRLTYKGLLHIVTDWGDYANNILRALEAADSCHNLYDSYAPVLANSRLTSKYEQRARQQDSPIFEILFVKE